MKFTIIVPTCNRNDLLSKCLKLLDKNIQTYLGEYEVIVSDDSIDNRARTLIQNEYSWVKWVEGSKCGPAANRNNGARSAVGEWLVFTDDDCLPQKDWLISYDNAININPKGLVFEGMTIADRVRERFDEISPINLTGNNLWSCNFVINKSSFYNLNGFDEGFPYAAMEDVDLYTRVIALTTLIFVPEAVIIHPWRRRIPFNSIKKHLYSHRYILNKHNSKRSFSYKLKRVKIFVTCMYYNFFILFKFSMKGWMVYLEDCILNFCLIFI